MSSKKTKIVFFKLPSDVMQCTRLCAFSLLDEFCSTVIETEILFPEVISVLIGG